jgi:large subunit ribosomal protein L6
MSRIGIKPIPKIEGVTVALKEREIVVTGPQGELTRILPDTVDVKIGDEIVVERKGDSKQARSDHGTIRALIANMMEGVKNGYKKELELVGMGYRAAMEGETLVLTVGWTHPVKIQPPEGITFSVNDNVFVDVSGPDKQLVGLWAAKVRSVRKPEPYKGKGIRYKDEVVRRKTSKTVKEE